MLRRLNVYCLRWLVTGRNRRPFNLGKRLLHSLGAFLTAQPRELRLEVGTDSDATREAGRELLEQLVGAHMVATDDEELFHLVNVALNDLNGRQGEAKLRMLIHSTYHAQAMINSLLDLATRQEAALEEAGLRPAWHLPADSDRFHQGRLGIWDRTRDHSGGRRIW